MELAGDDTRWVFDEERWSLAGELPPVGLGAVHLALDWVGFLEEHARKVYAPELNGAILDAHALAQQIEEGLITDGQTVREVQRTSRRWVERERLNAALALLERLNWLRVVEVEPGPLGGRPSEVVRLHPELREEQK
ncbi:hypothetical protein BW246_08710 [Helicobacter pylori]|nr:hypothetical protein BW246_08710 [Helicobacter pylori]